MFHEKRLSVDQPFWLSGRWVKTYRIDTPDAAIDPDVKRAAFRFLPRLFPNTEDGAGAVTFAVVHRAGDGIYLNAYSWVWDNVLFCKTAGSGAEPALGLATSGPTDIQELKQPWIGCVWELAVIEHERSAWVWWACARNTPDLSAYLADSVRTPTIGLPTHDQPVPIGITATH